MFYEIRRYQVRPGLRDEWVRYMEDTVIPFQVEQGMSVIASFVDEEDPDGYVWIRRFENEQERETLYAKVYQSDRWLNELSAKVGSYIFRDQIKVTRVVPTPNSGMK